MASEGEGDTKGEGSSVAFGGGFDEFGLEVTFGPFFVEDRAMVFARRTPSSPRSTELYNSLHHTTALKS